MDINGVGKNTCLWARSLGYCCLYCHSNSFGAVWTWECGVSQRCPHSSVKWGNHIFFVVVLAGLTMYFVNVPSQVLRRLKETPTLHCKIHNLYVDCNKEQRLGLIFWAWLFLTSLAEDWPQGLVLAGQEIYPTPEHNFSTLLISVEGKIVVFWATSKK